MLVATGAKTGAAPELNAPVNFRDIRSAIYLLLKSILIILDLSLVSLFFNVIKSALKSR